MHLCSECERGNPPHIEIARYMTTSKQDLYDGRANNTIYLCEKHLREKTDYQIRNAIPIHKDAKKPAHFVAVNAYKGNL